MPLALINTVPCAPSVTEATGDFTPSASISVSFASTSMITALSSFVVAISFTTTVNINGSLIAVVSAGSTSSVSPRRTSSEDSNLSSSKALWRSSAFISVDALFALAKFASPPSVD